MKRGWLPFLLLLTTVLISSCQFLPGEPIAEVTPLKTQPYTLLFNDSAEEFENSVKELLMVTSADPEDKTACEEILQRNNYLAQIIRSHWKVQVDLIQVDEYKEGDLDRYEALFLIEDYDKVPIRLMSDVVKSDNKKI